MGGWSLPAGTTLDEWDSWNVAAQDGPLHRGDRVPVTSRRAVLGPGGKEILLHGERRAPRDTVTTPLWPPVIGPEGLLLRRERATARGRRDTAGPGKPWLVRRDGSLDVLPFELGVAPLCALPDGRWLLPGEDELWRDDLDELASAMHPRGRIEPLWLGRRPVLPSAVLQEAIPDVRARLGRHGSDHAWELVGARVDPNSASLRVVIEVRPDEEQACVVADLPLDGSAPARLVAHVVPPPGGVVAVAP